MYVLRLRHSRSIVHASPFMAVLCCVPHDRAATTVPHSSIFGKHALQRRRRHKTRPRFISSRQAVSPRSVTRADMQRARYVACLPVPVALVRIAHRWPPLVGQAGECLSTVTPSLDLRRRGRAFGDCCGSTPACLFTRPWTQSSGPVTPSSSGQPCYSDRECATARGRARSAERRSAMAASSVLLPLVSIAVCVSDLERVLKSCSATHASAASPTWMSDLHHCHRYWPSA